MDKVTYRLIQDAWRKFDATTAYRCATSGISYNKDVAQAAWNQYNRVLYNLGSSMVQSAPIGLDITAPIN